MENLRQEHFKNKSLNRNLKYEHFRLNINVLDSSFDGLRQDVDLDRIAKRNDRVLLFILETIHLNIYLLILITLGQIVENGQLSLLLHL